MTQKTSSSTLRQFYGRYGHGLIALVLGWGLFGWGLLQAAPWQYEARLARALRNPAVQDLLMRPFDPQSAEAYWRAHPDVAADDIWGRKGPLGLRGAFLHYETQGRREGRAWPAPSHASQPEKP